MAQGLSASKLTSIGEAIDDRVAGLLVAGDGIALTYDDPAGTLTIDSTGGALSTGTLASRPAAGNAGKLYFATDAGFMFYDNGSAWQISVPGQALMTPPTVSAGALVDQYGNTWTNTNFSSDTVSASRGAALFHCPGQGNSTHLRSIVLSETFSGTAKGLEICFRTLNMESKAQHRMGVGFRKSGAWADTAGYGVFYGNGSPGLAEYVRFGDGDTALAGSVATRGPFWNSDFYWIRIQDDLTNHRCWWSRDGFQWNEFGGSLTEGHTVWTNPADAWSIYIDPRNGSMPNSDVDMLILHLAKF